MDAEDPRPSDTHEGEARSQWDAERTTFQRVYDYLVGTREFVTAAEFAERANCSEAGARSALDQLAEMGIADRRDTRPAGYRRNESYFRWKRIEELADEHTADELRDTVEDLIEEDEQFQEQYGVPAPDALSPETFETDDHEAIHELWEDVTEWRTIRRDIGLLQQAVYRAENRGVSETGSA